MPPGKIHRAISRKRTGKTYELLHKWIDEDDDGRGVDHRSKRHFYTNGLREAVFNSFGGTEAVSEWLFHIALDNLDTYFMNEWNYRKSEYNSFRFGFADNGFIYCEEEALTPKELKKEFDED